MPRDRRSSLSRTADVLFHRVLASAASVLRALPARWVLALADGVGFLLLLADARGRRVGRQNLEVAFGSALSLAERRQILLASFRQSARAALLLLHVSPLTPKRVRRWVAVPEDVARHLRRESAISPGGVLVSGHVGAWELLLGLPSLFSDLRPVVFLVESLGHPALDRFLDELRGSGGGAGAPRRGGARTVHRHVGRGGAAALLVDRNVRREDGGRWAPFLGLPARTTPLPGWIAVRHGVHVLPIFCLPGEGRRYRLWVGPNLAAGLEGLDEEATVHEVTLRMNRVLEDVVRAEPRLWNWTLKRFKSRPARELGPYPPYSLWDPDEGKGPPLSV